MPSISPSTIERCLAVPLLVAACRTASRPEPPAGRTCGGPPRGVTRLVRTVAVPQLAEGSLPRLVVQVSESADAREPIQGSQLIVSDSAGRFIAGQLGDSTGIARFDSLPDQPLTVLIRRIGYEPARFLVHPRVRVLDSLFVELATQPACIGY